MEGYFCSPHCKELFNHYKDTRPTVIEEIKAPDPESKENLSITGITIPVTDERAIIWSELGFQNHKSFSLLILYSAEQCCDAIEKFMQFLNSERWD